MLVDDDENDVCLLQHAFAEAGVSWAMQAVPDVTQAVAYLAGVGGHANRTLYPIPDLLLLDLVIRPKSGFDLLRWLREQPELRCKLVVVVLSGMESSAVMREAYELGVNSYLFKPADLENLIVMATRIKEYWMELNQMPRRAPHDAG